MLFVGAIKDLRTESRAVNQLCPGKQLQLALYRSHAGPNLTGNLANEKGFIRRTIEKRKNLPPGLSED